MYDFSLDPEQQHLDDGTPHHDYIDPHYNNDIYVCDILASRDAHHQTDVFDVIDSWHLGAIGELVDAFHANTQYQDTLHKDPMHYNALHQTHITDIDHNILKHIGPLGTALELLSGIDHAKLEYMGPLGHLLELFQAPTSDVSSLPLQNTVQYDHFQPTTDMSRVIGNPVTDITHWHYQNAPDTCAIVSQECILESLTGQHLSEEVLKQNAEAHGWYTPGSGTPLGCVGYLLEEFGLHVQRERGASLEKIAENLALHHKIIVSINAEDIWYHGEQNALVATYPGIPGQQADHAVQVIGIDNTQPTRPMIILNDPGTPNGRGIEIPEAIFDQAWATSGNYMVTVSDEPTTTITNGWFDQRRMIQGYYNADGTYHSNSDNTDRDPRTGTIIRRW